MISLLVLREVAARLSIMVSERIARPSTALRWPAFLVLSVDLVTVAASELAGRALSCGTAHGNVAVQKCQHCGLPGERFNYLNNAPCGRLIHRRCMADHVPHCDECRVAGALGLLDSLLPHLREAVDGLCRG